MRKTSHEKESRSERWSRLQSKHPLLGEVLNMTASVGCQCSSTGRVSVTRLIACLVRDCNHALLVCKMGGGETLGLALECLVPEQWREPCCVVWRGVCGASVQLREGGGSRRLDRDCASVQLWQFYARVSVGATTAHCSVLHED